MGDQFRCRHCRALWLPGISRWSWDAGTTQRVWHHDAPYRGARRRATRCAFRDGNALSDPYAPPGGRRAGEAADRAA